MIFAKDKKFKKVNFKAIFALNLSVFLFLTIVFTMFGYSWIFKTYFTNIQGINIALVESQGLIMSIDGSTTDTIDINTYLGDNASTFSLKEASSYNGRDLFFREYGSYFWDYENLYGSVDVARDDTGIMKLRLATTQDRNVNFLYFSFVLQSYGSDRYLVFDTNKSFIKNANDTLNYAIRTSFTFVENEVSTTKIVGNRSEFTGYNPTKAVESIDSENGVGFTTGQTVGTFDDYSGYENGNFNAAKTLYYLPMGIPVEAIICIWLEGGDPACTDEIAASFLNISLFFDNISVEEVE